MLPSVAYTLQQLRREGKSAVPEVQGVDRNQNAFRREKESQGHKEKTEGNNGWGTAFRRKFFD